MPFKSIFFVITISLIFKVSFVSLQWNAATIYVEMEDRVENIFSRVTRGVRVHEDFLGDIVKIVNLKCCSHTGISSLSHNRLYTS